MASSAGYLSSTEPSSPISADKYTKIFSSIDMSSSITSTDGIIGTLPVTDELSKYFPKLDSELHAITSELESDKLESEVFSLKDPEQESIRSITPISISSDISTPLATKGSTTAADLTTDDDEEATLSVDTCLSLPMSEHPTEKETPPSPTPSLPPMTTNRVQKQISLYESESISAHEFKLIVPPKKLPDHRKKFYANETSSLSQSSSNDNISFVKLSTPSPSSSSSTGNPTTSKTKSCMNLKSSCSPTVQHHPGAIIVKEKFIDPPKRLTSSVHRHTRCGSVDEKRLQRNETMRGNDPVMPLSNSGSFKSRFVATKVTEDEKDNK